MTAYLAYRIAAYAAEKSPTSASRRSALGLTAVDPQLGREAGSLLEDRLDNVAWRGRPPRPRAKAVTVRLDARPYPMVVVRDCPTPSTSWQPYMTTDNKPVPVQYPRGSAPQPFASTAVVIKYRSRWVVEKVATSMDKTCAP